MNPYIKKKEKFTEELKKAFKENRGYSRPTKSLNLQIGDKRAVT